MKKLLRSRFLPLALTCVYSLQVLPIAAAASSTGSRFSQDVLEVKGPQQTAEYIFRNSPRDNLITVQVFGSVARPGMYYVPEDTDLMKLLTLAGGVVNSSELDEVIVRKLEGRAWKGFNSKYVDQQNDQTYRIDVDGMLKHSPSVKPLRMSHDDFVYVPQKESIVSSDFQKILGIASVILTGVLTYVVIKDKSK